ncbi:MAG: FAD:protein FMN transferase [Verrucomicrobia bacterium]|nr:MAG: FAD:protein FMN transferase [Verrucomicrobiota bacterium]
MTSLHHNPGRMDGSPTVIPPRPWPVASVLERVRGSARLGMHGHAHELTFGAMGTNCRVQFASPGGNARRVADAVVEWVAGFEAKYSRFIDDSLASQINAAAGGPWMALDAEADRLVTLCDQLVFMTRGILDPTALPLIRLWDWKKARIPTDDEVAAAMPLVGWRQVQHAPGRIRLPLPGMALDFGGVGKEFAVDQVILLLARAGVTSALVDFGADVRVIGLPADGRPAWKIGLDDPLNPGTPWTHLVLREGAVATSGDYVRGFEAGGRRYGHIVDPRTGRPVDQGVLAASVFAPSCTQAGMLSTAACVLGPVEGRRLLESSPGIHGCIVTRKGTVTTSRFHEYVST